MSNGPQNGFDLRSYLRQHLFDARLSAGRATAAYALAVSCWIVFSDRIVALLDIPILHTFKGLAFVALSSTILYGYLRRKVDSQAAIEKTLAAASQSKTRLLASVSHDLRQPLQSLSLFASVLHSDSGLNPGSHLALNRLEQSVDRMGELLDAILDLAKLDVGIVADKQRPVPLDALLRELAHEMAPQADAKGLALKWVRTSAVVESDPVLLLTVLRNLVANAIRYTVHGKVVIGCRRRAGDYEIGIYDTGVGIEEDKLELIFEEFYQVGNPSRDNSLGLGLGLSIVCRLTRLLGHRVSVRSKVGRGSAFSVTVPRSPHPG